MTLRPALAFLVLFVVAPAAAQEGDAPTPVEAPEIDEPEPPVVPLERDTLGGHFSLAPGIVWAAPSGSLEEGVETPGSGPGASVELGFGVSRSVVLGAWGQLLSLDGATKACPDCAASSFAAGAFVRYHLVQGVRFDPWMSFGVGYRSMTIERAGAGDISYSGPEWIRATVGGDWYPARVLGLGPFLEADWGIFGGRSEGSVRESAGHLTLLVGARLVLDLPGK